MTLVALISIIFGIKVNELKFDYDFEKFYPADDPDTQFFNEFRQNFDSDNDFLLIAVQNNEGAFEKSFLQNIDAFVNDLEKKETVQYVLSITNQKELFLLSGGFVDTTSYIDFNDYNRTEDSARVYKNKELINTFVSEKGSALGLFLRHENYMSKKKSDELIDFIHAEAKKYGFDGIKLTGRTIGQKYYIEVMSSEMILFFLLSAVLVVVFLLIAFKSIWGILIPQVVILLGMLWLVGGMSVVGEPVNIILIVLPSIMFVVSMSDSIHFVSRYLDALRITDDSFDAIMIAIKEVGVATFLTSVTTAVGFFTLYFVRVQPIQVFGIVMGIGVMLAFLLTFLVLPALLYIFPGPKKVIRRNKDHFWKKYLDQSFKWIMNHPKSILITSVTLVLISAFGSTFIKADNYLMDDLKPDVQLKRDFEFMDKEFGGVRPFSLVVELKDTTKSFWDLDVLKELDTIQYYLEDEMGVHVRTSLVTVLRMMNRASHAGDPKYYQLPVKKRKISRYKMLLSLKKEVLNTMIDSTGQYLLISGTLPDAGNVEISRRRDLLNEYLDTRSQSIKYRVTGSAFLIDKNMGYLAKSMVLGLGLSILIVAFIMGFIYKSARVLIISIIPNVVPLILIAGIMGFVGVELKTSTAIIFTIAFGIAVDDTIHFLGKFKYEISKGKSKMYALKRSYMTTGKAMILTSLILCSGFLLLVMSNFVGTIYMGILLCITLLFALIIDLTLLPVLLMLFFKEKKMD